MINRYVVVKSKINSPAALVKANYQKGMVAITNEELIKKLNISKANLNGSLNRLKKKKQLFTPVKGFHVIVPLESQDTGVVPPDRFIHAMMEYLGKPYYVGLLSASRYYGVSSQVSQVYQVVTNQPRSEVKKNGIRIKFFTTRYISEAKVDLFKTDTGFIYISSRAQTMLDLIHLYAQCGGMSYVVSVLRELSQKIDLADFSSVIQSERELAHLRRLGYLLETYSNVKKLIQLVKTEIEQRSDTKSLTPLIPGLSIRHAQKNIRWNLWINYKVEIE